MASLDRRTGSERFDSLSRRALAVTGSVRPELSSAGAIKSEDAEDATSEAEWWPPQNTQRRASKRLTGNTLLVRDIP
jgi:hypothetical protein